ncbi:DUF5685 family protein [Williamsia sp. MIQD14]|uniref:DUF5685 family protein n=1 Tax=Williamsia sp. MIQD14 TaxID=3425703 RepID=UPI003DA0F9E9
MLGILRPCLRGSDPDVVDLWRAHLCGACLTLRDRHGQIARATLNTDAIAASVLLEAQQAVPDSRVRAGRCALRGMRPAQVIATDALSVRLAATASLTLAGAKATDEIGESELDLSGRSRLRGSLARGVARPLRRGAAGDDTIGHVLDTTAVIARVAGQAAVESVSTDLDEITAATEDACAAVFSATADLAGRPENRPALARIGAAFGRCGHLLDAVTDLAADRAAGAYNLIDATDASIDDVTTECLRLHHTIADEISRVHLRDGRLVRAMMIRGLHHSISRACAATPAPGRPVRSLAVATAASCAVASGGPEAEGCCTLRGCANCCGEFLGNCCCQGVCEACCSSCDCS